MERTEQRLFTTLDVYLTAFLTLHGMSPKLELRNERVVFVFSVCDNLYRSIMDFNSNVNIPVTDFVTTVKTLRGQMLTMRGGK